VQSMAIRKFRTAPVYLSREQDLFRPQERVTWFGLNQEVNSVRNLDKNRSSNAVPVVTAYCRRGVKCWQQGDFAKAVSDFTCALFVAPHESVVRFNRAVSLLANKSYLDALEDFSQLLSLDSKNFKYAYGNATTLLFCRRYREAVENFNLVERIMPAYGLNYLNRGVAYLHLGEWNSAVRDFSCAAELIEINEYKLSTCTQQEIDAVHNKASAFLNRGLCYLYLKEYHAASQDFSQLLMYEPTSQSYMLRSNAYAAIGLKELALEDKFKADKITREKWVLNVAGNIWFGIKAIGRMLTAQ
jgi:tetratricopeptide (TPR) repeat protein